MVEKEAIPESKHGASPQSTAKKRSLCSRKPLTPIRFAPRKTDRKATPHGVAFLSASFSFSFSQIGALPHFALFQTLSVPPLPGRRSESKGSDFHLCRRFSCGIVLHMVPADGSPSVMASPRTPSFSHPPVSFRFCGFPEPNCVISPYRRSDPLRV